MFVGKPQVIQQIFLRLDRKFIVIEIFRMLFVAQRQFFAL
jgi:hypothetical protein